VRRTDVSSDQSPTSPGQINRALGSSPLWLPEILRNHVVDRGLRALVESVPILGDRPNDRPVHQRNWNGATSRGVNIVPSAGPLRARQAFVMPGIGHNAAHNQAVATRGGRTALTMPVLANQRVIEDLVRSKALAIVAHPPVQTAAHAPPTATAHLGHLEQGDPLGRQTIALLDHLIDPLDLAKGAFKTDLKPVVPGAHVHPLEATIRNALEPGDPQPAGLLVLASETVASEPRLGVRRVLLAASDQQVAQTGLIASPGQVASAERSLLERNVIRVARQELGGP
jgi:hypothetical protein